MKKKIVLRISAKGIFEAAGCPMGDERACGIQYRSCSSNTYTNS